MITFIILITIVAIYCTIKAQNTADKRSATADRQIQELPPIHFHSQKTSTVNKILSLEFFESKDGILEDFRYNNGNLTLTLRSGQQLSGRLDQLAVRFEKISGLTVISVGYSDKNKITFSQYNNFTDNQWDTIINVLMLAGTTYGAYIFGSTYKNINRANLVMKVLSKL